MSEYYILLPDVRWENEDGCYNLVKNGIIITFPSQSQCTNDWLTFSMSIQNLLINSIGSGSLITTGDVNIYVLLD